MDFSANIRDKVWIHVWLTSFSFFWFGFGERAREREEGQMGSYLAKETPFVPPQPGIKTTLNIRVGVVGQDREVFVEKHGPKKIQRREDIANQISCSKCWSVCLRGFFFIE